MKKVYKIFFVAIGAYATEGVILDFQAYAREDLGVPVVVKKTLKAPRRFAEEEEKGVCPSKKKLKETTEHSASEIPLKKTSSKVKKAFYEEEEVALEKGKGSKKTGGGAGGFFWRIKVGTSTAGKIYINQVDEAPIGPHASIQIFLNKGSQGKHIGRIAYEKACKGSSYPVIYAHMRKNNTASQKAAEHAGFKICTDYPSYKQRLMKWARKP